MVKTVETGGNGNPGTNVTATSWAYTDPRSGVAYTSSDMASPSGTSIYVQFMVGTPAGKGARWVYTNLDPVQHLYAVSSDTGSAAPTLADDIQQIKKELDSGRATVDGTATVDGQPTIKLTMPTQEGGWTSTLYVNPQTYAPVQSFGEAPVNPRDPSADTDTTTEDVAAGNRREHRQRPAGADPGQLHAGLADRIGESKPGRSITQDLA